MGKILGIDLGTTNSCVSIYTEHEVCDSEPIKEMRVLHLEANKDTLPSVVRFVDRKLDNVVVGTPAKRMMIIKPNEVFASVKSLMRDDKWKEDKTVVDKFTIDGQELTPTDVSSIILKELLRLVKENNEIVIKYSSVIRNQSIYISKYLDYLPSKEEILMIIKKEKTND